MKTKQAIKTNQGVIEVDATTESYWLFSVHKSIGCVKYTITHKKTGMSIVDSVTKKDAIKALHIISQYASRVALFHTDNIEAISKNKDCYNIALKIRSFAKYGVDDIQSDLTELQAIPLTEINFNN